MTGSAIPLRRSLWVWGCLGFFLLSRMPAILCPYELNRDESQMAAQAMRYAQDLTPWRSVEGETNGPLDSWLLTAAHAVGMPLAYSALHALAAACLAAALLATYAALRKLAGDTAALIGLAAGSIWLALAPVEDFVHYSSELVPILLLSLAMAAIAGARRAGKGLDWRLGAVGGFLLGLAPWAKLQAGPVALALGIWAIWDGLRGPSDPVRDRGRYLAALTAGAIVPSALLLTWISAAGATEEFWRIYILGGLYHGRSRPWSEHLQNIEDLLFWRPSSPWFWDVVILTVGVARLWRRATRQTIPGTTLCLAAIWLAASVFVALRPITQWSHYSLFCLAPLMLCASICGGLLVGADARRLRSWMILALGVIALPAANFFKYHYDRAAEAMLPSSGGRAFEGQIFLAKAVRHFVPQPRSLAIWGWAPSIYVDLGLPPATRNAVCAFLMDDNPGRDFLRSAYMRDLEKSAPEVIVDVEDYVLHGQRKDSPDTFPALAAYLDQYYSLQGHAEPRRNRDYSLMINIYRRRTD